MIRWSFLRYSIYLHLVIGFLCYIYPFSQPVVDILRFGVMSLNSTLLFWWDAWLRTTLSAVASCVSSFCVNMCIFPFLKSQTSNVVCFCSRFYFRIYPLVGGLPSSFTIVQLTGFNRFQNLRRREGLDFGALNSQLVLIMI